MSEVLLVPLVALDPVLAWEDPPPAYGDRAKPSRKRSAKWLAIGAALRERPGVWARILDVGDRYSQQGGFSGLIKGGRMAAFRPAGAFEAVTRCVEGRTRVYARYVGDPS